MKSGGIVAVALIAGLAGVLASCGGAERAQAKNPQESGETAAASASTASVGVVRVGRQNLQRDLTLSSELIPFQEIEVYAKESGYVKQLNVDLGDHVKAGQVLATLEIPELQYQVQQDDDTIKTANNQIVFAQDEIHRAEAQHQVLHKEFERLDGVAKSKPGLVALQEVDDAQGKDLAAEAQVAAAKSSLESAQSQLQAAQAKRSHDEALFEYSRITAPFAGVVTQRYANLGTLLQAGTNSSTQAMPLVRLSQDDLFRLVIPVPESYVEYIREGDHVSVRVPALNQTFPGRVARSAVDVQEDTRTMHTEVDVPNPKRVLIAGMYAEATITLVSKNGAIAVPPEAISRDGDKTSVDVVTADNKIETREITLGIQTPNNIEAASGLSEGEMVVVSDRSGLKPGETVQPKPVQLIPPPAQ